jgi:carbapenam-3-carboxylate synthase
MFYSFDEEGHPVFSSRAVLILHLVPSARAFAVPGGERPLPPEGRTVFEGVYAVPPGSIQRFARNRHGWKLESSTRYFDLPRVHVDDLATAREMTRLSLESGVGNALNHVDEVSITLSGGVDSSAVAAIANQFGRRLRTWTVGSPFGNEFAQAAEVARFVGSRHRELTMETRDLEELLPELIQTFETWDAVTLQIAAPAAFIYKKTAAARSVFLTGYGADLLFAGVADVTLPEHMLEDSIFRQVRLTVPTNEFSASFASDYGITVRYPYWCRQVLVSALSIRARLKVRQGAVKYVLRSAALRWLPAEVASRRKVGIHEGSSMHRMFAECLGAPTLTEQTEILRSVAARVLLQNTAAAPFPTDRRVAECVSC